MLLLAILSWSGVVCVARCTGGKWTTYRLMAEETVDKCIKVCKLKAGKSATKGLLLEGAHDWTPTMFIRLIQDFGLDHKVTFHSLAWLLVATVIIILWPFDGASCINYHSMRFSCHSCCGDTMRLLLFLH